MNIALFAPEEINLPLSNKDSRAKHILEILHKKEGDSFEAGIIGGNAGKAHISKIDDVAIYFDFIPENDGIPLNSLKMIVGFPRPIQLKRLFRDMAGLGICEIHLTGTELTEKSYLQSNIVEKGTAENLLIEGSVQAKSTHIPKLFLHTDVSQCLHFLHIHDEFFENCAKATLDNVAPKHSLGQFMNHIINDEHLHCVKDVSKNTKKCVYAAIGSERGWTNNERNLLKNAGFISCSIGNRILRTESAATVAAAIILEKLGFI
ncbi:MAG: RsmE family RNA methyltransferase [Treponema sp.]|jgi:RsmE family RNA methyltransferase|nr:RsmE family RNA methyltransferase [Treponema sp.]